MNTLTLAQKASNSLEKDENYVPRTRSDLKLPKSESATKLDYHEVFEEAPIYTLGRLIFFTLCGFQVYMGYDVSIVLGNSPQLMCRAVKV